MTLPVVVYTSKFNFDKETDIIFREILTKRRVNYFQLESVLKMDSDFSDLTVDKFKEMISKAVSYLLNIGWIGNIASSNFELSIFYITADGSVAGDDKY